MSIAGDDSAMIAAIQQARQTVATFIKAIQSPGTSQSHFAVKAAFEDDYGREMMWLSEIEYRDGKFSGTLGNTPNSVRSVDYGDRVTVASDRIADWMFIDDGLLIGGYTMRVMRDRLSPEEREAMDASFEFRFE